MSGGQLPADAGFSKKQEDKDYLSEPPQPDVGTFQIPNFSDTRVHQGVRYFPLMRREDQPVQILGIGMSVLPEEATGLAETAHENVVINKGRLLKGPSGQMFKDMLRKQPDLHWDQFAYMTVIPWLLPKGRRFMPSKDEIEWCKPRVLTTIAQVKPQAIVVFGKKIFDLLVDEKISYDDARGAWFSHGEENIPVYLMDPVNFLISKPWTFETFCTDFREVNRFFHGRRTDIVVSEPPRLIECKTFEQVDQLVQRWEAEKLNAQSVDCEWSGTQHVDGGLRSIQFAWSENESAYLNFFDHTGQVHLGADYPRVGQILGRHLNKPEVKYLGHHFAADSPWMAHKLGLEVLGKCRFDSEYAQQTVDEYSPLGLEWMAMRYTNFGRYDMPLVRWKRANKALMKADEGYGKIPDDIMIPYACLDTLVVFQSEKPIRDQLYFQGLTDYFDRMLLPFVTDIFHTFVTEGLPVDRNLFEQTRSFMNWAYRTLLVNFKEGIVEQADRLMVDKSGVPLVVLDIWKQMLKGGRVAEVENSVKQMVGEEAWGTNGKQIFDHWIDAAGFNIRSTDHVRRWVFGCLGLTPVKSTAKKEQGMPSMMWEKVMELPEPARKQVTPSVDKETMEILQDKDPMIARLLQVSNVGNLCKGFLKEGDVDQDGILVEENGLAKFIASDCRIHGQYSLTETGRPRAWKPNVLNFPSYLNKGVAAGLGAILGKQKDGSFLEIPTEFEDLIGTPEERATIPMKDLLKTRMPTIRSTICAPHGFVFVESDYKTAEIRGLGFISGDIALIRLVVEKDPAYVIYDDGKEGKVVRLYYPEDSGIDPEHQYPEWINAISVDGKPQKIDLSKLKRDGYGELLHPAYDLHWSLAEMVHHKPREVLDEKKDRGAAKVGNFSSAYGAVASSLERKIEAQTGVKPPEGTGMAILEALLKRQPDAFAFLDETAKAPASGFPLVAQSGRKRHFPVHPSEMTGMSWRVRQAYLRPMGNEARNFFPQESVAATSARASSWLLAFYRRNGLQARPVTCLYDSLLSLCPLEERFVVRKAHDVFMCDINTWQYHGRWMNYPIDNQFNYRWSWRPEKEEMERLEERNYHGMDLGRETELLNILDTVVRNRDEIFPDIAARLNKV